MVYLLQWVIISSFEINTDLQIDPNSIPYPVTVIHAVEINVTNG